MESKLGFLNSHTTPGAHQASHTATTDTAGCPPIQFCSDTLAAGRGRKPRVLFHGAVTQHPAQPHPRTTWTQENPAFRRSHLSVSTVSLPAWVPLSSQLYARPYHPGLRATCSLCLSCWQTKQFLWTSMIQ